MYPRKSLQFFYNSSNYDYHFIIKELANEFERLFQCFPENTEKYKTFSVPIEKGVTKTDKDGNESVVNISYKIKFIDGARFMASSLSNLAGNLAGGIHKIKCKCLSCNKDYSNSLDDKLKK